MLLFSLSQCLDGCVFSRLSFRHFSIALVQKMLLLLMVSLFYFFLSFFATPQSGSFKGVTRSTSEITVRISLVLNTNLTLGVRLFSIKFFNCATIRLFIVKNGVRRLYLQCLCIVLNGLAHTHTQKVHFPIKQGVCLERQSDIQASHSSIYLC